MSQPRRIGILLFDDVEVLDFAGPLEVFSVTSGPNGGPGFSVSTVAETTELIRARNGLKVKRDIKYIDEGPVMSSGGISAGINLALYIVEKLYGLAAARETACQMEYDIEL